MRLIMVLVMIAGGLMAFGYPAWVDVFSGEEIGSFSLATRATAPGGPTVYLDPTDAPVGIAIGVAVPDIAERPASGDPEVVYSWSIARDGVEVAADSARFTYVYSSKDQAGRPAQPVQEMTVLRIDPVEKGDYDFTIARTDNGVMPVAEAKLVLRRNVSVSDERIAPIGYLLLVVGTVGVVVLGRRRKPAAATPRPPRMNKWGRQ